MKVNKIVLSFAIVFVLFINAVSCTYQYKSINRNMLEGRNLRLWDYYHSVDYCKRIDIFDSISEFIFDIENYNKLLPMEKQGVTFNQLYEKVPNNLYGYLFSDINTKADTLCCISGTYFGDFFGTWWLHNEIPPTIDNLDSLKKLVHLWKQKLNCDSLNTN